MHALSPPSFFALPAQVAIWERSIKSSQKGLYFPSQVGPQSHSPPAMHQAQAQPFVSFVGRQGLWIFRVFWVFLAVWAVWEVHF